jgi:regulation of enolase protein 1 (concanavalin A-like superfamily)
MCRYDTESAMMTTLSLSPIPGELHWKNNPVNWKVGSGNSLSITAGAKTDWFVEPSGSDWVASNAPAAMFTPPNENFLLSAKVTVEFASTFDAGVLLLYERDDLWTKLCFEYSPQKQPMIVSVVTRGVSDDCNSTVINGNTVHLRVARMGDAFGLHYSLDGKYWNMVRYFTLGKLENLQVGFEAQSPMGEGCNVMFSEIAYRADLLKDMRTGE